MEPLFRVLVVGVIPQPTQVPPLPYDREALQRAYFDVSRSYPYEQFGFLPADQGAQFLRPPEDRVLLQVNGPLQVHTPIESTPALAREKAVAILRIATERLKVANFLVAGIKIVAHVPAPDGGAKMFVGDRLLGGSERSAELGANFYGGGAKFRAFDPTDPAALEEVLLVEPFALDDDFIWLDYDIQRRHPFSGLDQLSSWVDDAFKFVREPAMTMLKEASNGS